MKSVLEGLLFVVGDEGIELKKISEILEINEEDVSRYQFTLIYKNKEWELKDGDREGRYHSTNGTYLMVSKKTEIVNGMQFICNGHTFTAEITH